MLLTVAVFIAILSFLVIIHEAGHFLLAKWAKVTTLEFGLGYPPKAWSLGKFWGTEFTLNWIPFGGFVRMDGEDHEDTSDDQKSETITERKHSKAVTKTTGLFYQKTAFQRLAIILAGPLVNIIFAIVAFSVVYGVLGVPVEQHMPIIAEVMPGSPAEKSGLQANTKIIAIKSTNELVSVTSSDDVIAVVGQHRGETLTVTTTGKCNQGSCQEIAQEFQVYVRTESETPENQGALGVVFEGVVFKHFPWYEHPFRAIWYGCLQAFSVTKLILQALAEVVGQVVRSGNVSSQLAGPVGIVAEAKKAGLVQEGILALINFAGMLSLNLGIMNLLPIPALDGGRAFFILIEQLVGKKHTQKIEAKLHYGGFVVLCFLIVLITIRDVWNLFR